MALEVIGRNLIGREPADFHETYSKLSIIGEVGYLEIIRELGQVWFPREKSESVMRCVGEIVVGELPAAAAIL